MTLTFAPVDAAVDPAAGLIDAMRAEPVALRAAHAPEPVGHAGGAVAPGRTVPRRLGR